ncbi:hypothetical protein ACNR9Q_03825 [Maribacter sp. X9]|uniref:hypothetical protein n=1 Tax=Maribacter sp. X9 TaxID=3402159 RepID=UPI003AF37E6E
MQKKKLDELFQEKFLDFKQSPDDKVWRAIDASLNKKKNKRIIPIWWRLGGIAAALAIAFLLFNPFSNQQTTKEILVETQNDVKNITDAQQESTTENSFDSTDNNGTDQLVEKSSDKTDITENDNSVSSKNDKKLATPSPKENTILKVTRSIKESEVIVLNSDERESGTVAKNDKTLAGTTLAPATGSKTDGENKNTITNSIPTNEHANNNRVDFKSSNDSSAVASTEHKDQELLEENKKSIFDELVDQEEDLAQNETKNRWSAGPSIAPVYFNGMGKGSPVNSIFVPNSKSGTINMSYGVSVAYAVSKKVTIRSGIHKVDYGYDTEDVSFSSSLNSISSNGQLASIDYAPTSNTLVISSEKVASDKYSTVNSSADVTAKSAAREGFMSQQLGYLELPVEVNYALVDNKFGINLIGGVSSLFLINNAVSLTAGELTTEIGEANNINELNFSANMGLGLNYKFSRKIRFNVEPIFKYQLNTFSDINGTFRPYSIGIYSGLNFKF